MIDRVPVEPFVTPVAPVCVDRLALHPVSSTRITIGDGFWRPRLDANRNASLLHGANELERAGNFHNVRVAAKQAEGGYRGFSAIGVPYLFLDSDIYKWLEAVAWESTRGDLAPELEAAARGAVALLQAAQEPDGYLNSYFQITTPGRRFHELVVGHELYCAGHLIQAGVAARRTGWSQDLFDIAVRNADCISAEFVERGNPGLPAHPGIEMALVELYRETRAQPHLQLARAFIDRRGQGHLGAGRFGSSYYEDHVLVRDATSITGHAVMAVYLASAMVDAYVETGETALLQAAERQMADLVSTKMYLTGGFGSRYRDEAIGDPYELPPDRAYCETCASVGSIMTFWRLLLATGDGKYADLIERTLYNGVLPGVSLDGRRFFYTNPLHVRPAHFDPPEGIGSAERKPWFYCACCPPNVMRTFSSLEHLVATATAKGVQLHQFVAGAVNVQLPDGDEIRLEVTTEYPWSGAVSVRVGGTPTPAWEMSLRIPDWARGSARLVVGGEARPVLPDEQGYARIARTWQSGDVVELHFTLQPRWTFPDQRIDSIRGCVALERGPIVYCFESTDLPAGADLDVLAVRIGDVDQAELGGAMAGMSVLKCEGVQDPSPQSSWPYGTAAFEATAPSWSFGLIGIPYFAWANRERSSMRVWLPQARDSKDREP